MGEWKGKALKASTCVMTNKTRESEVDQSCRLSCRLDSVKQRAERWHVLSCVGPAVLWWQERSPQAHATVSQERQAEQGPSQQAHHVCDTAGGWELSERSNFRLAQCRSAVPCP